MSQREVMILLAHAQLCAPCRRRLLANPSAILIGRHLTSAEKDSLSQLRDEDFLTPEVLARAAGTTASELGSYQYHPITRLRHF